MHIERPSRCRNITAMFRQSTLNVFPFEMLNGHPQGNCMNADVVNS
jgi:hypothetical protein